MPYDQPELCSSANSRRQPLPVDGIVEDLLISLRRHGSTVLRAAPGAGKTTRVPPAFIDAGLAAGTVVVLEPRRLAARAAARRVAWERETIVGGEVGYEVRFDRQRGPGTRLLYVTEGVFLRFLQKDPFLEGIGAVVFDEFHERHLDADLALAMTRRVQREVRKDLKILVMSATLLAERVAAFLGQAPLIESEGRLYPVEVRYLDSPERRSLAQATCASVLAALEQTKGDVLAFLPGLREIRDTGKLLAETSGRQSLLVLELYGDLPADKQDRVLQPASQRKVVLATNLAETSLTVEGVTGVVDAGLARIPRHEPAVGLDRLLTQRISRASAEQRAGRAGRTEPGLCLRLWTRTEHRHLQDHELPEIHRRDLAGAVLQLLAWGESDPAAFDWLEPPPPLTVAGAMTLLERLGACESGRLTSTGQVMAQLPIHPRLGRLLIEGHCLGRIEDSALAAALLSERAPFLRSPETLQEQVSESDVLDRIETIEAFEQTGQRHSSVGSINVGAVRLLLRARDRLARLARKTLGAPGPCTDSREDTLGRALLLAFPDRLARRRMPNSNRGVMVGGRGVRLSDRSAVRRPELFLCIDTDAGSGEAIVRQASAVHRHWLDEARLQVSTEVAFDTEQKRVRAWRRTRYEDLVLDEAITDLPDPPLVAEELARAAAQRLTQSLALDEPAVAGFLARIDFLRRTMPELALPAIDDRLLCSLLPDLCAGRRSLAELRRAPLLSVLQSRLTPAQHVALREDAPERLQVPSGSQIRLHYEIGRPPVLAVRIQELFGLTETPRLARGRVPVLMHLLAPNYRPQQITDDLRGFWTNTYPVIRKELRGRYPKHSWPEDPLAALPERRPRRRT